MPIYQINCSLYGGSGYEWIGVDPGTLSDEQKRSYCNGINTFRESGVDFDPHGSINGETEKNDANSLSSKKQE